MEVRSLSASIEGRSLARLAGRNDVTLSIRNKKKAKGGWIKVDRSTEGEVGAASGVGVRSVGGNHFISTFGSGSFSI